MTVALSKERFMAVPEAASGRLVISEKHCLLLFHSTHETMHAESLLKSDRLRFKLIPRPRDIQDDCGLGLVINKEDLPRVETLIAPRYVYLKAALYLEKDGTWIRKNFPPAPTS
jgi:hypothetical protein